VQVDAELLLHRAFILDHQHGRAQDLGGTINLQPRGQGRKPDFPILVTLPSKTLIFQALTYTIFNNN